MSWLNCVSCGDQYITNYPHLCSANKGRDAFTTKDSGERATFATGMVRDVSTDKVRYDLVWMPMLKRWAELMGRGAKKYTPNNWKKACTQEELDRFKESAIRHFMQWFNDEAQDEDHAAAIYFNVAGAEYVKGRLPSEMRGAPEESGDTHVPQR